MDHRVVVIVHRVASDLGIVLDLCRENFCYLVVCGAVTRSVRAIKVRLI